MRKINNDELTRLTVDDFKVADKMPIVVVLDHVRSCNNVGSIFRTSDALLVRKICLCGITAVPPDKEIHKTALGAENSVEWEYFKTTEEAVETLRKEGYTIIAIEQVEESISLHDFLPAPGEKLALIFGNEVKGVQQEIVNLCDKTIEIPQFGTKHSFNIAVSAGIVLWDLFNKLKHS
ncbi:MAG TPA: RNA methyltransferase [Prolixibacteraceae bacterium]|nr:RNA methyltransferase [Prolixibacteraceae bacterium]